MSVEVSRIANGLTVVTESMPHLQSAALGVWVKAGSRSEREDEHGLSHLLEHMAFKGTEKRSAVAIAEEIEAVGGDLNAATSVETTSYYARVLKEDVPLGVDILSDILVNSLFDEEELGREKHVVVQEIGAALDAPEDRVYDMFVEGAYPGQPIGRTILGTQATVGGAGRQSLLGFLGRHYHGPEMILSAAGAVDHAEMVRLAEKGFGGLDATVSERPRPARYRGVERNEQRDLQEAQLMIGLEGVRYSAETFHASQLLASVLGGGMSSRLFQEVREKRGLCYSIGAFHWAFSDTGLFGIHAATGESDVKELVPVILGELERAADDIDEKELGRSRAQMRAGLLMALESPAARAGQLARQIISFGRPIPIEEAVARIEAVSAMDLRNLALSMFSSSSPTVAAIGPIEGMMSQDRIAARLGTSRAA